MKIINNIINWWNRYTTINDIKTKLGFYPELNMYNADQFTFEDINEILTLKHQLKQL